MCPDILLSHIWVGPDVIRAERSEQETDSVTLMKVNPGLLIEVSWCEVGEHLVSS